VCAHVLAAARALVWLPQATTKLTHFLSAFPKDLLMQEVRVFLNPPSLSVEVEKGFLFLLSMCIVKNPIFFTHNYQYPSTHGLEFTVLFIPGVLHRCLLQWLHPGQALEGLHASLDTNKSLSEDLRAMLHDYLMPQSVVSSEITDDELDAWRVEVKKWARLFALEVVSFESQLQLIQVNFFSKLLNSASKSEKRKFLNLKPYTLHAH